MNQIIGNSDRIKHLDVTPIISGLLKNHACVTVKDFGAFVVNPASASVERRKNFLTPPGKRVSFNKNITHNDGLLANALSREWGLSYEDAIAVIDGYAAEIREAIHAMGYFVFSDIGTLSNAGNGVLQFEPSEEKINTSDTFGLEPFHLTPVSRQVPLVETPVDIETEEKNEVKYLYKYSAWGKVGWAVAAIPLIAYLIWLPTSSGVFDKNHQFQYSDLNPFRTAGQYDARNENPVAEEKVTLSDIIPVKEKESDEDENIPAHRVEERATEAAEEVAVVPKEEKPAAASENSSLPVYQIVAGCFREEANAQDLSNKLTKLGYDALVFDKHNGLYRVSYGTFNEEKKAREMLDEIRKIDNNSAWIYREE